MPTMKTPLLTRIRAAAATESLLGALLSRSYGSKVIRTSPTVSRNFHAQISRRQQEQQSSSPAPPPASAPPPPFKQKKDSITPQSGAGKTRPAIRWTTVAISVGLGGVLYWYLKRLDNEKQLARYAERQKSIGRSKIGGEWVDLVDQNGVKRSYKDYLGSWILLYFGFTHCPDVCPDELEKLCKAIDILQERNPKEKFSPIFMTVDPKRDDVTSVKKYVAEFSPKLIGLTGDEETIKDVAKKFRVYYSAGPESNEDYIVDHTIIIYLIDPEGQFLDYYGQTKTANEIALRVEGHMTKQSLLKFW